MAGSHHQLLCLGAALAWIAVVWAIRLLPPRRRRAVLMVAVAAGVPLLGWLTYCLGPIFGSLGFAAGLVLLMIAPVGEPAPETMAERLTGPATRRRRLR